MNVVRNLETGITLPYHTAEQVPDVMLATGAGVCEVTTGAVGEPIFVETEQTQWSDRAGWLLAGCCWWVAL